MENEVLIWVETRYGSFVEIMGNPWENLSTFERIVQSGRLTFKVLTSDLDLIESWNEAISLYAEVPDDILKTIANGNFRLFIICANEVTEVDNVVAVHVGVGQDIVVNYLRVTLKVHPLRENQYLLVAKTATTWPFAVTLVNKFNTRDELHRALKDEEETLKLFSFGQEKREGDLWREIFNERRISDEQRRTIQSAKVQLFFQQAYHTVESIDNVKLFPVEFKDEAVFVRMMVVTNGQSFFADRS